MRAALFAAVIVCAALMSEYAFAAQGVIKVIADPVHTDDHTLVEALNVVNPVYIVHTDWVSATEVRFKVAHNWNSAVVQSVDFGANLYLGDIFGGVDVVYVGCKPLPHLIATINFIPSETSPQCTLVYSTADPSTPSGRIEVVDCSGVTRYAAGSYLCVQQSDSYYCEELGPGCELPVAAEANTWGGIKALYR